MENEKTSRIAGITSPIQDMADDINQTRKTTAAHIKEAQASMDRYQEIIDAFNKNRGEAKSVSDNVNKTPIGVVESIKNNMAAAQEQKYQDAIHER